LTPVAIRPPLPIEATRKDTMPGTTIRPEVAADEAAIRRVNVEAFRDHPFSRQTEHLIVEALRAADALEVSLVAELNGEVVGHIAFSRARIGDADDARDARGGGVAGGPGDWYLLGPVAVLPEHQRHGTGSRLVEAGIAALRARGAGGCLLVGDPAFYSRLGFVRASGVTWPGVPPENLLWLPLAGPLPAGDVSFNEAFSIEPEERALDG
jgi:putative acetyltransferase